MQVQDRYWRKAVLGGQRHREQQTRRSPQQEIPAIRQQRAMQALFSICFNQWMGAAIYTGLVLPAARVARSFGTAKVRRSACSSSGSSPPASAVSAAAG